MFAPIRLPAQVRLGVALAFLLAHAGAVLAGDTAELVPFASDEGLVRLARSDARADFAALANQFEAQSNAAFCGPTTAAIVLIQGNPFLAPVGVTSAPVLAVLNGFFAR